MIFKEYFIKELYIKKRYVGTESINKMINYNNVLKEILGEKLVIVDRLTMSGEIVSASKVRQLLVENKFDEALELVPREIAFILRNIAREKYGTNR